jgi:protein ImuB
VQRAGKSESVRVACLLVPELPAAAALRAEPELADRPLAVVSEAGPRAVVVSLSPAGARAGLHPGDALAHARAVCAGLAVRVASPAREAAARAALLDVALSVSPRAEGAAPGSGARAGEAIVHLEVSGLERLYPSEAGLANALVARAQRLALPAVVVLAGSRAAATLLARALARREGPGATRVIAPGAEARALASLPTDLLELDDVLAGTLSRFGLRRIGELLALPPALVASRLGSEAAVRLAPLRGQGGEPPIPMPRVARLEEELDFETPLDRLEPLAFALGGLLTRLLGRLAVRHLACGELELRLALESSGASAVEREGMDVRRVRLAAPSVEPRTWLRRLRAVLESDPPGAAIAGCGLAAEGQPARRDQLDLFRPAGPAPAALDALVAELAALCGEHRVGSPRIPDDPRPGAFSLGPFALEPSRDPPAGRAAPGPGSLALRMLRPPLPAVVRLCAGRPAWVGSAMSSGTVVHCAGPWRTTGGWWSEAQRFAFDSFDVATHDGLLMRLRYDHLRRRWEIDALYD